MRHRIHSHLTATLAAGLLVSHVLGCRDTVAPTQSAAISVSVKLAGVYPFDGFAILVDHRPMTLLKTESSLVVRGLSAGSHTVGLADLASNCRNDGSNDVTVDTSSGELSTVEFRVTCLATSGAIAVVVSVSGYTGPLPLQAQVDSAFAGYGYMIVRGYAKTVLETSFSAGVHVVRLFGIPRYCEGELSASVNVTTGAVMQDTAVASFNFSCETPQFGADTAASIAFERDGYVMVVRESGSSPVALADGTMPSWSPDGRLITFERLSCEEFDCEHDLWAMEPTGNNKRPLVADKYFDDFDASVSPNGTNLAFMRFWPGPDQIYLAVSSMDGSSVRILSIWHPHATPTWSPDGALIAFVCWDFGGGNMDLCVLGTDKSCTSYFVNQCNLPNPVHITTSPGDETDPAWSPDGRRIAFTLACAAGFPPPLQGPCPPGITLDEPYIAVIDVTNREVTRLVAGHDPAWSPDGSQLVFTGNAGSPGLRVYSFADGSVRHLTDNRDDRSPAWR